MNDIQAEKIVRIRSLVSMGYNMNNIEMIYKNAQETMTLEREEELKSFVGDLENFTFQNAITDSTDYRTLLTIGLY